MTAEKLRLNTASWQGMGNDHGHIFTYGVSGARSRFVEEAAQRFSDGPVASIKALINYDAKRPEAHVGSYLVTFGSGERIVLHAKEYVHPETYDLSNQIYGVYRSHGISAAKIEPMLDGSRYAVQDGLHIYATSYIEGRHPDRIEDIFEIAVEIARTHDASSDLSSNILSQVKENSATTLALFQSGIDVFRSEKGRDILARAGVTEANDVAYLASCVDAYEKACTHMALSSSDMIPGNVLIDDFDGTVAFLDFDNIGASWMPYGTDIGLAIYRIGMDFAKDENGCSNDRAVVDDFCDGFNAVARGDKTLNTAKLENMAIVGNVTKFLGNMAAAALDEVRIPNVNRFATMLFQIRDRFAALKGDAGGVAPRP